MSIHPTDWKVLTAAEQDLAKQLSDLLPKDSLNGKVCSELLLKHLINERVLKRKAMRELKALRELTRSMSAIERIPV